jgi:hypothetical protein
MTNHRWSNLFCIAKHLGIECKDFFVEMPVYQKKQVFAEICDAKEEKKSVV